MFAHQTNSNFIHYYPALVVVNKIECLYIAGGSIN